jgi:hypothetical protein
MDEMREKEVQNIEVQEEAGAREVQEEVFNQLQEEVQEEPEPKITVEMLQELLGEVGKTPEIEKGIETEGEEDEKETEEDVDFSILGDALYSIYVQGLQWGTYVILSRIIPGYEKEVLSEVSLPRSAQRQLVKAFNRFLQKKFNDWSIKLSEEGLVLSLLLLYSITYMGQAMMMAYRLRKMYAYQVQIQTQEEEPKPKRSSRRRSSSRSRSRSRNSGRRNSRTKKTVEVVNGETE